MDNPYDYNLAVRDDAMFFGQQELLEQLVKRLSGPLPHSAAIFGGRRCGKTSLLSKLGRLLSKSQAAGKRRFVLCNLDLQRGRPLTCIDDFFLWVLEELGETWEVQRKLAPGSMVDMLQTRYRNTARFGPVKAFEQAFLLGTQGKRLRLVILLDESEQILTVEWCDDLRPNLRALLGNSSIREDVALVMAGSTQMYLQTTDSASPLANILDKHKLLPLAREATLLLARQPNQEHLPESVAETVWEQSGGQPCLTQFILYSLWENLNGSLEKATNSDVQMVVDTFDEATQHFTTWTCKFGIHGQDMYRFLAQHPASLSRTELRQQFQHWSADLFRSTLDALTYHGVIHCTGRGRQERYTFAGHAYLEWFLAAGQFQEAPEPPESALEKARRVLNVLETKAAGYTSLTIPEDLQIKLEDKRKEVAQLEAALGDSHVHS